MAEAEASRTLWDVGVSGPGVAVKSPLSSVSEARAACPWRAALAAAGWRATACLEGESPVAAGAASRVPPHGAAAGAGGCAQASVRSCLRPPSGGGTGEGLPALRCKIGKSGFLFEKK